MGDIIVPVTVGPGDSATPFGPQVNITYTLTGPDGARVVFNDQTDLDYVGVLSEVSGLDSPEVRESAEDRVQMDGGLHGDFFYGRRPVTMRGLVLNPASTVDRNQRINRLLRATNAMRQDAQLTWTLEGNEQQFINVRRQQPVRIEGGWQKEFFLPLVSADPRIYGLTLNAATAAGAVSSVTCENTGNTTTYPQLTVFGPFTAVTIFNETTGEQIIYTGTIPNGGYLVIDTLNRTVREDDITDRYSGINFNATSWFGIPSGSNVIRFTFTGSGAATSARVEWRNAWL